MLSVKKTSQPIPIPGKKKSLPRKKNYDSYELKESPHILISNSPDISLENFTPPSSSPIDKKSLSKLLYFLSNN